MNENPQSSEKEVPKSGQSSQNRPNQNKKRNNPTQQGMQQQDQQRSTPKNQNKVVYVRRSQQNEISSEQSEEVKKENDDTETKQPFVSNQNASKQNTKNQGDDSSKLPKQKEQGKQNFKSQQNGLNSNKDQQREHNTSNGRRQNYQKDKQPLDQPNKGLESNNKKQPNQKQKEPEDESQKAIQEAIVQERKQERKLSRENERKNKEAALRRREEQGGKGSDEQEDEEDGDQEEFKIDITKVSKNEVRETLIKRMKRKKIDCPICYEKIGLKASIWSCQQCYHPFHLECLKKWITNSNKDKKSNVLLLTWSCPFCQYIYSDKMPTYVCFCTKFQSPEFDPYMIPHSCGETCNKKRGTNCSHPCDIPCHPGPCAPCQLKGDPIRCYCGKQKKDILCSDSATSYECGNVCGKNLNCGTHTCQRQCHAGDCGKCTQTIIGASCFCGNTSKDSLCGNNYFSCNKQCNKTLTCGNHKCFDTCHSGPCQECKLGPDDVDSCPCGKISLLTLTGGNFRESCKDQIPICGGPCKKIVSCGVHACKRSCHEGQCPQCKEPVEEICRCSYTNRIVQCYELREPDHIPYSCDRICKKLKSCKVHPCNTLCCPARKGTDPQGIHLCLKVCDKPLSCGKHNCELFCHLGICNKCPIKVNEQISCVCGKTTLAPPQLCGTKPPECHEPCSRKKECGHPCHLDCHPDECPPCEFKVEKVCHCGRQVVKDVSCSKEALCTIPCNKVMSCGHKCDTVCHVGECPKDNVETGCGRICNKKRSFCDHKCAAFCHGTSDCPEDPCKVEVVIKCKCGEREAFVECGAFDGFLDLNLACSALCKNISRFSRFHEKGKIYYAAMLTRFARQKMEFLQKIEKKVENFVRSSDNDMIIPFENDEIKKQVVQQLLGKHYHLNISYYSHSKTPYFVVERTQGMVIPKMLLSEYYKKIERGEIKPEILPYDTSLRFSPAARMEHDQQQLNLILRDFLKDFYTENEDRSLVIHFWDRVIEFIN